VSAQPAESTQPAEAAQVPAEPEPDDAQPMRVLESADLADPTTGLERYLADRGLDELAAALLRGRLAAARGESRTDLAERLGRLYVRLLGRADDADTRQRLEAHARELIRAVPDSESFDLRLDLAKATFLRAEEGVEKHRLRLASAEELGEAERVLRSVEPVFDDIAARVNTRLQSDERRLNESRNADAVELQLRVTESRRIRSMARYYAGWTKHYLALAGANKELARQALLDFGVILNAQPGRAPAIDRVPANTLRFEHVARAGVGVMLSLSLRGDHDEALKWLRLLESAESLPKGVADQLPARRIAVLAAGGFWNELERRIALDRRKQGQSEPVPLSLREARLLAVVALEALPELSGADGRRRGGIAAQTLAQVGMGDLVALGEVGHVLDLVKRFGTAPIGTEGFIVTYVRGLQAFDAARQAHADLGDDTDKPSDDESAINRYVQAAELLESAADAADADKFPLDRPKAVMRAALARYLADQPELASTLFQEASSLLGVLPAASGPSAERLRSERQEALWMAVVALDRGVELGRLSLTPTRDTLAALFIEQFPRTERAARLLLRRAGAGLTDEQAVEILLGVGRSAPVYAAARREAARRLYQIYLGSRGDGREFAAIRFADVAEESLELDAAAAGPDSGALAPAAVLRGRQLVMVLLDQPTPDLPRAARALDRVEALAAAAGIDTAPFADELIFRRLRLAMLKGDDQSVQRWLDRLRASGGRFALAGERLVLNRAAEAFRAGPRDTAQARRVVEAARRVLAALDAEPGSIPPVAEQLAAAAAALWELDNDPTMRELAIATDRREVEAGRATARTLRRLAALAEASGDAPAALDAWRRLLAGSADASAQWFEARYHTLRLLAALEPARFAEALSQHKVLYPSFGPEPWGPKIRDLESQPPQPRTKPGAGPPQ
jgi:hypothetical protein